MATPPFLPDETKPADADIVSQFPAVERLFRDIIEDWLLIDHDTNGQHKQVALAESASDPSAETNIGKLYTKDDGADTELYYIDDSGNVVQITADGALLTFPATTSMFFYQSAAPTGWTKDVAATLGNHALKLVTDVAWSGGSKGATAFDTVFGSGKTAGATTLTAAQSGLPAHIHTITGNFLGDPGIGISAIGGGSFNYVNPVVQSVAAASAALSHNHTLSLDLNHIQVIRATKD